MARPRGMALAHPERLRQAMAGKYNVTTLAREAGISRSYLVMILGGKRTCSEDTANAIAAALRIRTDLLFTTFLADDSATNPKEA